MPWKIRLVKYGSWPDRVGPSVGDAFYRAWTPDAWKAAVDEWRKEGANRDARPVQHLSDYFIAHNINKRPPLIVVLPGLNWFCVDSCPSGPGADRSGWTVDGDPPNITISPSINCIGKGGYHGFVKNGEISDDVDGRKFTPDGSRERDG